MGMWGRVALASALATLASALVMAAGAAASPVTLTWSGLGGHWSERANWVGGEAPGEVAEPVDLDFPLGVCEPDPVGCPATTDDLAGLTVDTIELDSRAIAFTPEGPGEPPPIAPGPASYSVSGDEALTLMGGVDADTTEEGSGTGLSSSFTTLDLPLVLGAPNSWSVGPAPGGLNVWGPVTGDHPLAVTLADGDQLELAGKTDVGPITITGETQVIFGGPEADGDLNGSDGEPVELNGVSLWGGGRIGPLTLEGAGLEPGFPGAGGKLEVNGNLSLDSASRFTIEENPAGKGSEVTVSGHAQLGSARLAVREGCVEPGSTLTLIRAQGGVSGRFTGPGGLPVESGQLLENLSPEACGAAMSDPAPTLRIEYGPDTVTATAVVDQPQSSTPPPTGSSNAGASLSGASSSARGAISAYAASSPKLTVSGPVKVRPGELLVPLRCVSSEGACASVGLRLSVLERLLNGHVTAVSAARSRHRTTRTVVLASRRVTLAAGQSRTVELSLDSAAARIAVHGTVRALLGVSYEGRTIRSEAIEIPAAARSRR